MGRATHNLTLGGCCARGIENGLHWQMDVAFNEDRMRQRDRNRAENLALLNRARDPNRFSDGSHAPVAQLRAELAAQAMRRAAPKSSSK
jgi:hypothetical protein